MFRCSGCESLYLNPRPSPAGIGLAYASYYTHASPSESATAGRLQALKVAIKNGFVNSRLRTHLTPASRAGRWLVPPVFPFASPGRGIVVDHLRAPEGRRRFFEVGAGSGAWLEAAAGLGW